MQTILIKPDLLQLVREGKKTTTCRFGIRTYELGETLLESNVSKDDYTKINITGLKYHKLKEINDDMAKNDGFENLVNLVKVLKEIYGDVNSETDITIVEFEVVED